MMHLNSYTTLNMCRENGMHYDEECNQNYRDIISY